MVHMMHVLVVDDDKDLLDMVSYVLGRNNIAVDCIDRGSTLFESLAARRPDIVLMDIYLGDSDGRELCRTLKNSASFQDIPVILYSAGNIPAASIENSMADDFIAKPFDLTYLLKRIDQQVKKAG
jgi:DNA-binding response OmpR family regulator